LHQTGFQEVLSAADLLGRYPHELTLIGVQALNLEDWGGSLTPLVKSKMDEVIDLSVKQLQTWGVDVQQRDNPLTTEDAILGHGLDLSRYEAGHPLRGVGG